jgi:hypothetical protein
MVRSRRDLVPEIVTLRQRLMVLRRQPGQGRSTENRPIGTAVDPAYGKLDSEVGCAPHPGGAWQDRHRGSDSTIWCYQPLRVGLTPRTPGVS